MKLTPADQAIISEAIDEAMNCGLSDDSACDHVEKVLRFNGFHDDAVAKEIAYNAVHSIQQVSA